MVWLDFLSACKTALDQHGADWIDYGRPAGAFMLGLVGGATHCAAMCGPFVVGQVCARLGQTPVSRPILTRLGGMALLPYHAGRAVTYSALGAAAAGIAGGAGALTAQGTLPAIALGSGALLMALAAVRYLAPAGSFIVGTGGPSRWLETRLPSLLTRPGHANNFMLGLLLGFLPCGLVYTALLFAGASGSWSAGALMMAAFAAGTTPALLMVGFLGAAAGARWRLRMRRWIAPVLLFNAAMLLLLALRWLTA